MQLRFPDGPLPGRQVRQQAAAGTQAELSLHGLRAGCHLVQVSTPNGGQRTQHLLVQP